MSKSPFVATLSWAETLYQLLHGFQVDGGPGQPGPVLSREAGQIAAAGVLRQIAGQIRDAKLAAEVRKLGLDLAERGTAELVRAFNGDGPPWTDLPFPFPWPPKKFDPRVSVFDGLKPGALDTALAGVAHRLADAALKPLAGGSTRGG